MTIQITKASCFKMAERWRLTPFRWSPFRYTVNRENPTFLSQCFVHGHAGAKHVDASYSTLRDVHGESRTPARPGGVTWVRNCKTSFMTENCGNFLLISHCNCSCEISGRGTVSFTASALCAVLIGSHARYFR